MKTTATAFARKLALAAAVAGLAPAAAHACDLPRPAERAAFPSSGPAAVVRVDAPWRDEDRGWREGDRDRDWRDGDHDRDRRWRDGDREGWRPRVPGWFAWRARERAELRTEYARLDDARARFYAVPQPPWRVRRFEAWYAHEHAQLDVRWARVS